MEKNLPIIQACINFKEQCFIFSILELYGLWKFIYTVQLQVGWGENGVLVGTQRTTQSYQCISALSRPMRGQYPGYEITLDQSEASFRSCDLSPPPPNISPLKVINASLLSPDQHCCCYHWLNTLWKQTSARYQLLFDTLSDHFPACIIKMSSQDVKRTTEVFV